MNDQDIKKVLDTLQTFAQRLEKDGLYNDKHQLALERVAALLSKEDVKTSTLDLLPVSLAAEDFLNRVVNTVERSDDGKSNEKDHAMMRVEMSSVYYLLGNWDEALLRLKEALSLSQQAGDEAGQAAAYAGIGKVQSRRAIWDEATDALESALTLYRKLNDKKGEAHTQLLLGNAAFLLCEYDEARSLMNDALGAAEEAGAEDVVGDIHLSLGVVDQVAGQADQAIDHFMESLSQFERINDRGRMSVAYFNLGIANVEQEVWPQAGRYYEKSLTYARETGDLSLVGMIYLRRGEMQTKVSDTKMALRYGRRAMQIFDQLAMPSGQADVYRLYGEIATMTNTPDDARVFLSESRRLQQQIGSKLGELEVAETEAVLNEKIGEHKQAKAQYNEAISQLEGLGASGVHTRRMQDAMKRLEKKALRGH